MLSWIIPTSTGGNSSYPKGGVSCFKDSFECNLTKLKGIAAQCHTFVIMMKDHLVIFDGVCNLCNSTVQFIIKRDRKKKFSFTTYQSGVGQDILKQQGFPATDQSTVVYVKNGVPCFKSKAVLEILRDLGCCWNLFYILIVIPPFIRDFVYDIIAKSRYWVFGKRESCMVPNPELMERFLR
jgi:predicted DCC family thiol-disulfide oxidoreductase YuxK